MLSKCVYFGGILHGVASDLPDFVASIYQKGRAMRARGDALVVTLLTSSQINSPVSPAWLAMSCWSPGDREKPRPRGYACVAWQR